jgi:hypothetical protein
MPIEEEDLQMTTLAIDESHKQISNRNSHKNSRIRLKYSSVTIQRVLNILQVASEGLKHEIDLFTKCSLDKSQNEPINSIDNNNHKIHRENGTKLFLLRFSAGWIYTSILTVGISFLEKIKDYHKALQYLELLLSGPYCPHRRGHWWNRYCSISEL